MGGEIVEIWMTTLSDPLLTSSPLMHNLKTSNENREVGLHESLSKFVVRSKPTINNRYLSHNFKLLHIHGLMMLIE